jgi:HlyD family secretion protein
MKQYLLLLFAVMLFVRCGSKKEKVNPVKENITESVYASGLLRAVNQYEVFSPVNGLIAQIFVKEGDTVKKDDPIILVKSDQARLNIEQAKITLDKNDIGTNRDKLNELQANINYLRSKTKNDSLLLERQRNLWKENIGSRIELEQKELALKNDMASYEASLARYRDLARQLGFAAAQSRNSLAISKTAAGDFTIRSQVDGRIYNIVKKDAEMVNTQTPVAIIGRAGDFILELQVDEFDISKIQAGQKILISMDSYKGTAFEGRVTRVIPYMNERTRSFTVEAVFVTKPPRLYPNLTVEANIVIREQQNALTIPRDYLLNDSLVLLSGGEKRKVITGLKDYRKVEIISGLSTDDVIIKPAP